MKKYLKWIILFLILAIIGIIIYSCSNTTTTTQEEYMDYAPAQEISDEQLKRTAVSLYYLNTNTNEIIKDEKLISTKNLIENPEKSLIEELAKETSLENTICPIATNTKINSITIEKNIAQIDFSKEFLEHGLTTVEQEEKLLGCIANTLCQLNEINGVKILIDGQTLDKSNLGLDLTQVFLPISIS